MKPNTYPSRQHSPNRWARLKQQLKQARTEVATTAKENTQLIVYLATQGLCDDFQQWKAKNDPSTVAEVALLLSQVVRARDEAAEEMLLDMEQANRESK